MRVPREGFVLAGLVPPAGALAGRAELGVPEPIGAFGPALPVGIGISVVAEPVGVPPAVVAGGAAGTGNGGSGDFGSGIGVLLTLAK